VTTDWQAARRLEELVDRPQLPQYARMAMREAAELIRTLDEELYVRGAIITRLHAGEPHPGPGQPLADIRAEYHRDLQRVRAERAERS
jgi:hypothetical protein